MLIGTFGNTYGSGVAMIAAMSSVWLAAVPGKAGATVGVATTGIGPGGALTPGAIWLDVVLGIGWPGEDGPPPNALLDAAEPVLDAADEVVARGCPTGVSGVAICAENAGCGLFPCEATATGTDVGGVDELPQFGLQFIEGGEEVATAGNPAAADDVYHRRAGYSILYVSIDEGYMNSHVATAPRYSMTVTESVGVEASLLTTGHLPVRVIAQCCPMAYNKCAPSNTPSPVSTAFLTSE